MIQSSDTLNFRIRWLVPYQQISSSKQSNAEEHGSLISMYGVPMDVEKCYKFWIIERNGEVTKEDYMITTKKGINPLYWEITVTNPMKVQLIVGSIWQGGNEAPILFYLFSFRIEKRFSFNWRRRNKCTQKVNWFQFLLNVC